MSLPSKSVEHSTYANYKQVPVEWIGKIPDEWSIKKARFCFNEIDERSETGEEQLLSLSKDEGLVPRDQLTDEEHRADSLSGYKICEPGDIVMNKMQAWNGMFGLASQKGLVSPDYTVLRPQDGICSSFYNYLFHTPLYISQFKWRSQGVGTAYLRLKTRDFFDIRLVHPPYKTQKNIADFLDTRIERIRQLVEKKGELVELLEEKKKKITKDAVTSGLDPSVNTKTTGVPWLGEIPEHWRLSKVSFELENLDSERIPLSSEEREEMQGDYPYYGASGVIDHVDDYLFEGTHVLVSEDGMNLLLRSKPVAFVAEGKYWVNNHAHILKPPEGDEKYFAYLLNSLDYSNEIQGARQVKLTSQSLSNMKIPVPPLEEQLEIRNWIEQRHEEIGETIDSIEQSVQLLKKKQETLISSFVLGERKVESSTLSGTEKREIP